jgi:hypothetical protein
MKHLMVDIETLGTKRDASILSIGACMFDINKGIGAKFEVNLKNDGRVIDPDTVRWWLQQNQAAQAKLFDPEPVDQKKARTLFGQFIETHGAKKIWANGALFDLNILRNFYHEYPPWRYTQEMCMRSIRCLGDEIGISYGQWWTENNQNDDIHHGALDDAIRQAKYVIDVFKLARGDED